MVSRCIHCGQFILSPLPNGKCPCTEKNYYQVWDNWQGKGYRLYYGNDKSACQVDGEINGTVYSTIKEAQAECLRRFGETATRVK